MTVDSPEIPSDILLVDDTPENLRLLSSILSKHGYKTRKVTNGALALKVIKRAPPDLILLDVMMPSLNGYEVCQSLKADPDTADIPVIFISALDDVFDKVKAFSVGGVDYITKPFQIEEVVARIENQLVIRNLQRELQAKNVSLQAAVEQFDQLLLNVLPQSIVNSLKQRDFPIIKGKPIAESFAEATILFADIAGFTEIAAQMPAIEIVDLLNQIFSGFDKLAEHHHLEKIKTIGDAYMVASGIPIPSWNHAHTVAQMALDMQQEIQAFCQNSQHSFKLRIGINTGPVVAGVIGIKKFSYDLWGDTVNVASRMESQGVAGKIQVTEATYQLLKEHYTFDLRGAIKIKGKGEMKTYFLTGRKATASLL